MESITKTKVSEGKIREIIEFYFPEDSICSMEEMTGGMQNSAWLVILSSKKVIVKIGVLPNADILRYEKNNLYAEKEFYGRMGGKNIPLPQLYVFDDTKKFLQSPFMIMSYIEGISWRSCLSSLTRENKKELLYQIGKYSAEIHSVVGEKFGYVRNNDAFLFDTWYEAFAAMVGAILEDGRERMFELLSAQINNLLLKYKDVLNEINTPHLVDFDLWAGNIMLTNKENPKITGIFDFGNSFYGDPYAEFVTAVHLYKDVRVENDFQRGYSKITGKAFEITENDTIRMKLYQLYLDLILYVESYRYNAGQKNLDKLKNNILRDIDGLS